MGVAEGDSRRELLGFARVSGLLAANPGNRRDLSHEVEALVRFVVLQVRADAIEDTLFHIHQHR